MKETVPAAVSSPEKTENESADDSLDSNEWTEPEAYPLSNTIEEDIPEYDFTQLLEINPDVKGWLRMGCKPQLCDLRTFDAGRIDDDYIWFEFFGDEDYLNYVQMMTELAAWLYMPRL